MTSDWFDPLYHIYHAFIHSGDLYNAFSRDYYSEALPAQSRTKKKDFIGIIVVAMSLYRTSSR